MDEIRRALVVEDEAAWREIIGEILAEAGFQVYPAATYGEAVQALDQNPFQLVVVDISLSHDDHGNRDGVRVLEHVAGLKQNAPIIVVTGHGTVELAVETLTTYSAANFIQKASFDRPAFIESIRQLTGSTASRSPSRVEGTDRSGSPTGRSGFRDTPGQTARRALVIEDDQGWQSIYRELIQEVGLTVQVVVSYGEARGWLGREKFELAVVDLELVSSTQPEGNKDGYRLLRATQEKAIPTIVVTGLAEPNEVDRAFDEFEVFAFLDKGGFARGEFSRTVRDALGSSAVVRGPRLESLTARELEVLGLLAQGKTNKEIADELIISPNTVKKHVYSIFGKLDVPTRSAATSLAIQSGLVERMLRQADEDG